MIPHSVYLHIPFCRHRCGYCDFNTYAGLEDLIPAYTNALCREIQAFSSTSANRLPVHTIFFGGGTPSLLPLDDLETILMAVDRHFDLTSDAEITIELNPGTIHPAYFTGLKKIGFNRLSMGVQSANPQELKLLERDHTYLHAIRAVKFARQAGFDNLNLDLIFGLPYQSLSSWQHTLKLAGGLNPDHLSLYALSLEHGTPLQYMVARGMLPFPDPDLAADMYLWSQEYLAAEGYLQYEISNWAALDSFGLPRMSRHNLQYWLNLPYIGLGAGAHGYVANARTSNVLAPSAYIERLTHPRSFNFPATPASVQTNNLDRATEMSETMMMGLRLVRTGISNRAFKDRFGIPLEHAFPQEISNLIDSELIEWIGEGVKKSLRLTTNGHLLGNQVFLRFIS